MAGGGSSSSHSPQPGRQHTPHIQSRRRCARILLRNRVFELACLHTCTSAHKVLCAHTTTRAPLECLLALVPSSNHNGTHPTTIALIQPQWHSSNHKDTHPTTMALQQRLTQLAATPGSMCWCSVLARPLLMDTDRLKSALLSPLSKATGALRPFMLSADPTLFCPNLCSFTKPKPLTRELHQSTGHGHLDAHRGRCLASSVCCPFSQRAHAMNGSAHEGMRPSARCNAGVRACVTCTSTRAHAFPMHSRQCQAQAQAHAGLGKARSRCSIANVRPRCMLTRAEGAQSRAGRRRGHRRRHQRFPPAPLAWASGQGVGTTRHARPR